MIQTSELVHKIRLLTGMWVNRLIHRWLLSAHMPICCTSVAYMANAANPTANAWQARRASSHHALSPSACAMASSTSALEQRAIVVLQATTDFVSSSAGITGFSGEALWSSGVYTRQGNSRTQRRHHEEKPHSQRVRYLPFERKRTRESVGYDRSGQKTKAVSLP